MPHHGLAERGAVVGKEKTASTWRDLGHKVGRVKPRLHLEVLPEGVLDEGAAPHARPVYEHFFLKVAHADEGDVVHVAEHRQQAQRRAEIGGRLQPHSILREHRVRVLGGTRPEELGVVDTLRVSLHRPSNSRESYRTRNDAVVRHDEHEGRARLGKRLTNREGRALPPREPHHSRASEGIVLSAEACDLENVVSIQHGLVIGDDTKLALAAPSHLEAVTHYELPAVREPAVPVQRREALAQHSGARIRADRRAGDHDSYEILCERRRCASRHF